MPQFNKNLDVNHGYNYKKDQHHPVGFINSLKIGDTELPAHTSCKVPGDPKISIEVVAVLSGISWQTGISKVHIATVLYCMGYLRKGEKIFTWQLPMSSRRK